MGYYKKHKFTSKEGDDYWVYEPTIYKKNSIFIKGKHETFLKKRR